MMTGNEVSLHFDLDEGVFLHFPCFEGIIPSGYWGNFLGVFTRAEVWELSKEVKKISNKARTEKFDYPLNDEHILDWYPLLQSVISVKEKFTMAAIGAGWGRWLSAGAFAAKYCNIDYFLIGVEAEPRHFQWMKIHMKDNKISSKKYRLIPAAASDNCGNCWFYVGKPASWYGQSMVSDEKLELPSDLLSKIKDLLNIRTQIEYNNETIQRMPCVDLKEVVKNHNLLDYMMLDIQGTEEIFLTKYPDILQKQVKMINIGTHSTDIENNLRKYFSDMGWICTFDIPMNSVVQFNIRKKAYESNAGTTKIVKFGDGIQIWINNQI